MGFEVIEEEYECQGCGKQCVTVNGLPAHVCNGRPPRSDDDDE